MSKLFTGGNDAGLGLRRTGRSAPSNCCAMCGSAWPCGWRWPGTRLGLLRHLLPVIAGNLIGGSVRAGLTQHVIDRRDPAWQASDGPGPG